MQSFFNLWSLSLGAGQAGGSGGGGVRVFSALFAAHAARPRPQARALDLGSDGRFPSPFPHPRQLCAAAGRCREALL